jgi:allantoinase
MLSVVRSTRVVLADGVHPATIVIRDGRIDAVRAHDTDDGDALDAGDLVVLPGLVDTHVHVNEPGRTDWEGFAHATRAAAAGGVTTIVDMPLNAVPATTTLAGLAAKIGAAEGQCHVDVGFWGGVVPGNAAEIEPLARRGVRGFKCFLSPSGVDEFAHVTEADLHDALPILARLQLPLLVHAELPSALLDVDPAADPRAYATWLASRPPAAEHDAIDLAVRLARRYGRASMSCTWRAPARCRRYARRGPTASVSRSRPARTTCRLPPSGSRMAPPRSSARRRSVKGAIRMPCGKRSWTATSIWWRAIIPRRLPR